MLPDEARGKQLEVWFQDEARIGQQGTLTRLWARKGTRPRAPKDRRYDWAYLFGAACPSRGIAETLVLPRADGDAFRRHLYAISKRVGKDAHAALVIDNAGYHTTKGDDLPANITLVPLPPYSPELNPIENVWEYLRKNKLANTVFETYQDIVDACCDAWNFFAHDPNAVTSVTSRSWATVND